MKWSVLVSAVVLVAVAEVTEVRMRALEEDKKRAVKGGREGQN